MSDFAFASYHERFQWDVYAQLDLLLKSLADRVQEGDALESQAAAQIHKDQVMVHFYNHSAKGRPEAFISHSTCFSCLFEPPEHALPCGHILCTSCIRAYGHAKGRTIVEMDSCPLESLIRPRYGLWRVFIKPASAGIRILTLDGYAKPPISMYEYSLLTVVSGGIRGIVELETLRQIEHALGGRLAIQCFFDLIVGTGYDISPAVWQLARCS